MNNLMSNAIKFTKTNGISLELTWEMEPQEMLCLDLRGIGIGMSEEQQHMIFDLSFRPTRRSRALMAGRD
jgi:signal transduction histidine kinase